ncbi:acyltransferase [Sphingomonas sp. VNH70]|uniref:acyltransferase family protein n=1 Tax=Sphingomonas silueang TaxID=3156617 RepID=UPI0032B332CC
MTGAPIAAEREAYRPYLDGLRACCILFTIAAHVDTMPWWVNGSIGVDIFFALSGWLITWLLLGERERTGGIDLRGFYIRRIFRIVPLYLVMIAAYGAIATVADGGARATEYWRSLPYMLGFTIEYRPESIGPMFQQAWTLGIEEKFYLVWPLLLVVARARGHRAGPAAVLLVALLFVAFGTTGYIIRGYAGLGIGSTLALLVRHRPAVAAWAARTPCSAIGYAVVALCYVGLITLPHPWAWNVGVAAAAGLAIASGWMRPGQAVNRLLGQRWLAWLGTLTYAIYLVQSLAILVAERGIARVGLPLHPLIVFVAAYAICIVAAWALHRLIERPLIDYGRRLARKGG